MRCDPHLARGGIEPREGEDQPGGGRPQRVAEREPLLGGPVDPLRQGGAESRVQRVPLGVEQDGILPGRRGKRALDQSRDEHQLERQAQGAAER